MEDAEKSDGKDPTRVLENAIREVCRMGLSAVVSEENGRFRVDITAQKNLSSEAEVQLTPFRRVTFQPLQKEMTFPDLDLLEVSELYRLKASREGTAVERVVVIPTKNLPDGREKAVVNSVVKDRHSFVDYVAMVLGDPLFRFAEPGESTERHGSSGGSGGSGEVLPGLYERMLRTALNEPERLEEIGRILEVAEENVIPEGFRELYSTFCRVLEERK